MKKMLFIILGVAVAAAAVWYFGFRTPGTDAGRNYIGRSAEECSRIQVMCIPGFERFDDESGCGCQPVSVQIPSDWKTYTSKYGFTMRYDPTLTVDDDNTGGVRFWKWGPTQRGQTEMYDGIIISIRTVSAPQGMDAYLTTWIAQMKENGTITEELHDGMLNGIPTKELGYTGLGEYRFVFVQADSDSLLEISSMTPDPTGAGFRASADAMLATLELR